MLDDAITADIIAAVRPYSMVPDAGLAFTIQTCAKMIEQAIDGVIVECGAWRGGASFAMLLAQRRLYGQIKKPVWLLDSFQGLPPVDQRDGPAAIAWQSEKEAPGYMDNCAAALEEVRNAKDGFQFSDEECVIVPGWFHDSVPSLVPRFAQSRISLLRVDCDWYEPVKFVLDNLSEAVTPDGYIILDDYYFWDGCALATHDFLAENRLSWRIKSIPQLHGAFMQNRRHRVDQL